MNEDILQQPNQEKLFIKVDIATEKDWETCRDLRLEAIDSPDAEMFGFTSGQEKSEENKAKEIAKTEGDWKKELSDPDMFMVLARNGSEAVGMARAFKKTENWWHMGWIYTKENFRRKGFGKMMTAKRLDEIKKRGPNVNLVTVFIKVGNEKSIKNCRSFGFEKVDFSSKEFSQELKLETQKHFFEIFKLDLNNSAVIKKIDEILNA